MKPIRLNVVVEKKASFIWFAALCVFIISLLFAFNLQQITPYNRLLTTTAKFNNKNTKYAYKGIYTNNGNLSFLPTPTATPSPTLTPTSTVATESANADYKPAPNDYCLYVPIFMYHHIENYQEAQQEGHAQLTVADTWFDQQMQYLTTHGYTSIGLQQLIDDLYARQPVPAKSFVVTIDDGYVDWYTYAWPILKKYHVIGNLMVPSGLIGNPDYLSWDQLKEMASSNVIQVYNHTWSHASLGGATKDKIEFEMTTSQQQLQTELGKPINIMAYPYGSFSPLAISILQQDHFIAALTTMPGQTECLSNVMELPRVRIGNAPMSSYGY